MARLFGSPPRIDFTRTASNLGLAGNIGLTTAEAANFDAIVQERTAEIRRWSPPSQPRRGLWPDEIEAEQATPLADSKLEDSKLEDSKLEDSKIMIDIKPTNLILYGPPGSGKTYATAAEAVRLCGEPVSEDREELMAAYRRLSDAGRIELVTFHQSIAHEDFVEGLRPTQAAEESAAGFELKSVQGVFRRIVRRAETSTGPGDADFSIIGRQVFKMSIGEAAIGQSSPGEDAISIRLSSTD